MVCDQRSRNLVWRSTAWRTRRRSRPMSMRPTPSTTNDDCTWLSPRPSRHPHRRQLPQRGGARPLCRHPRRHGHHSSALAAAVGKEGRQPKDLRHGVCATTCEDEAAAAMLPSTAVLSAPPPCCPNASPAAVLQESQSEECGGEGSRGLEYKSDMYH
jgi:hypothetical protein